jgi:hypothetical protein
MPKNFRRSDIKEIIVIGPLSGGQDGSRVDRGIVPPERQYSSRILFSLSFLLLSYSRKISRKANFKISSLNILHRLTYVWVFASESKFTCRATDKEIFVQKYCSSN